jgi:hypothetical protein
VIGTSGPVCFLENRDLALFASSDALFFNVFAIPDVLFFAVLNAAFAAFTATNAITFGYNIKVSDYYTISLYFWNPYTLRSEASPPPFQSLFFLTWGLILLRGKLIVLL